MADNGGLTVWDDLPPRNRTFVEEFIRSGDAHTSYLAAGYTDDGKVKVKSRALLESLEAHVAERAVALMKSPELLTLALSTIQKLADGAASETVQLNAAKVLLERAAPEGPKEVKHHHTVDLSGLSDEVIDQRIRDAQAKLGVGVVIDGEADDVTPE